ncbi:deoxyguanosinetriphosphate triphosphohydrolase [Sphingorhabdus sp.]|uniref:deoxyguanosinetriphosphate triphosphohydrolase n=1 Tax=Sphingorhabdus sp. TaxID=1902408 RepID=UPI00333FE097
MSQLAPYASFPDHSRGRLHAEPKSDIRGPRDIFQRDRDRIIHSIAFRRLRHKTQVFISPDGDHYRVRLTHSLEVAQIGRTIARALGLNEDLTEALCLAHDIGHPPFGHAGEDALEAAMKPFGGFDHNAQTLRTLTHLESPYPSWPGLNLSWELLEGLAKHNGPVARPGWALTEVDAGFDLRLTDWPSLEAQIAAISDDIAYDNHDIDDGIRAGLLDIDQLLELPFVAERWEAILVRHPDVRPRRLIGELTREQIGIMVNDVIESTRGRIKELGIKNADDVRKAGVMIGGFSSEMAARERLLKAFMYEKLYHHPTQNEAAVGASKIVRELFVAYRNDVRLLPLEWRENLPEHDPQRSRHVGDFLAGMTDHYATDRHREIYRDMA